MTHLDPGRFAEPRTTVVALASDPLLRAELGGFLDGLGLVVLAELEPGELEDFLHASGGLDAIVWDVDEADALPASSGTLLALVLNLEVAAHALRSGATGVLSRDTDGERLRTALRAMHDGLAVLEPAFLPIVEPGEDPEINLGNEPPPQASFAQDPRDE